VSALAVLASGCGRVGYHALATTAHVDAAADGATPSLGDGSAIEPIAASTEARPAEAAVGPPQPDTAGPDAAPPVPDAPSPPDVATDGPAPDLPVEAPSPDMAAGPDASSPDRPPPVDAPLPLMGNVNNVYSNVATAPWVVNGGARLSGNSVQLTGALVNQAGSVYLSQPFGIRDGTTFSIQFQFRVHGGDGALGGDGFALVWQSSPAGAGALGDPGGSLGYAPIRPSVAVEFDEYMDALGDPNDNHVAVDMNGSVTAPHAVGNTLPFDLNDANQHWAWIDYDGAAHTLRVYVASSNTKPGSPVLYDTVDLLAVVGDRAFLGFSAGTGTKDAIHELSFLMVGFRY
jgi:hypothetical protein